VLARKWRPQQFSDIVGQSPIVRTLMNAINLKRIHQAYLFTGSRGIGKTSVARIFSQAIRCDGKRWKDDFLYSCAECPSCREIITGSGVDVIEIDGASNNGVDSIREIRENAKFLPSNGAWKIYIIDEVHMLTTAAFNALLKTLEEPPEHVIFIFATTEPHKIPATILSRCQRFDFRRVTVNQTEERLKKIAKAEEVDVEQSALTLLAKAAEGSMRDALSLFDQVIAFSGKKVTANNVRDGLGLIEGAVIFKIIEAVLKRNAVLAIAQIKEAYLAGQDLRVLSRHLIELLHSIILSKVGAADLDQMGYSVDEKESIAEFSSYRPLEELELIFQALNHAVEWIARSPQPRLILDVVLIKCAHAEALAPLSGSTPLSQTSQGACGENKSHSAGGFEFNSDNTSTKTLDVQIKTENKLETSQIETTQNIKTNLDTPKAEDAPTWLGFIENVRKIRPLLASILENGNRISLPTNNSSESRGDLIVTYKPTDTYFKEQLQSKVYHDQLLKICKDYFGYTIHLRVELKEGGESLAEKKERQKHQKEIDTKEAVKNNPLIKEAQSLFGGQMGPVEIKTSSKAFVEGGGGRGE